MNCNDVPDPDWKENPECDWIDDDGVKYSQEEVDAAEQLAYDDIAKEILKGDEK